MESNDSPEVPGRGETLDIPGPPSGGGGGRELAYINVCREGTWCISLRGKKNIHMCIIFHEPVQTSVYTSEVKFLSASERI